MVVTVLKTTFAKGKPKEITYRDTKSEVLFRSELKKKLDSNILGYIDFENIFMETLENHAPLKKESDQGKSSYLHDQNLKEGNNEKI